jgi:hypothetical protein
MTEPTARQRLLPVFIGVIVLAWLAQQRRNAAPLALPIELIEPLDQAAIDSPLVIRFTTREPLALRPSGWGTEKLHLHARVGGVEHMPAAAEIQQSDSIFTWTLPGVPRGTHAVRLGWADQRHRELSAGASPARTITVR